MAGFNDRENAYPRWDDGNNNSYSMWDHDGTVRQITRSPRDPKTGLRPWYPNPSMPLPVRGFTRSGPLLPVQDPLPWDQGWTPSLGSTLREMRDPAASTPTVPTFGADKRALAGSPKNRPLDVSPVPKAAETPLPPLEPTTMPTMEPAATPPESMPSPPSPAPAPVRPSLPAAPTQDELYPGGVDSSGRRVFTEAELDSVPSPLAPFFARKAEREKAAESQRRLEQRNSAYPYRYKSESDRNDAYRDIVNERYYAENEDGTIDQRLPTDREAQNQADRSFRASGRQYMPRITSNQTFPGQINPNVGRATIPDPYGGKPLYAWQGKKTPQGRIVFKSSKTGESFSIPDPDSPVTQALEEKKNKKPERVSGIYGGPGSSTPRYWSYQPEYEGDTRGLDFREETRPMIQGGDGRVRAEVPGYVVRPWEREVGTTTGGINSALLRPSASAPVAPPAAAGSNPAPVAPPAAGAVRPPVSQRAKPKQSASPSVRGGSTRPSGIPNVTPPTGVNRENWSGIGDNEIFDPRVVRPRVEPNQPYVERVAPRISQVDGPTATVDGEFGEEAPTVDTPPAVTVPNQYRQSIAQKLLSSQRIGELAPGQFIRRLPEGPGQFIRRPANAFGTTRPEIDGERLLQAFSDESFGDTRPPSINLNGSVLPQIMGGVGAVGATATGAAPTSSTSATPSGSRGLGFGTRYPLTPGGLLNFIVNDQLERRFGGVSRAADAIRQATAPEETEKNYEAEAVPAPGGPTGASYPPSSLPPRTEPEPEADLDQYGRRRERYMPANELAENYNRRAATIGWNPVETDASGLPVLYGRQGERLAGPAMEKAMFDRLQKAIYRQGMNEKKDAWDRIRANRAAQQAGYANAVEMNAYTRSRLPTAVRGNEVDANREFAASLLPALIGSDPAQVAEMMPAIQAAQSGNMAGFTQAMGQAASRGQRRQQAMDVISANPGRAQQIGALMDAGFSPQEVQQYIPGGISERDQVELRRRTAPSWIDRNRNIPVNTPAWHPSWWANLAGNLSDQIYTNPSSPWYDDAYKAEAQRKARERARVRNFPASRSLPNTTVPSR